MKTVIMCGYPGVGKSTAMRKMYNNQWVKVIDLDSAIFKEKIRNPESLNPWYIDYVNFAVQLADMHNAGCDYPSGDGTKPEPISILYILLSAHKEVREYINFLGKDFFYVVPALDRREEWLEMIKARANDLKGEERQAAMRAFMRVSGSYTSDITAALAEKEKPTLKCQHVECLYHGYIYDIVQTDYRSPCCVKL